MKKQILIVGGVAGGASAAAKVRRECEDCDIHVFERGPYISFANCGLPYYIGKEIGSRDQLLLASPESFKKKYNVDVHVETEVLSIQPKEKTILVKGPNGEKQFSYDKLIVSQGASPLVPPFKGVDKKHVFTLRNIPDMDKIFSYSNENSLKSAVVIGGGFIGLEMAEAFAHRGLQVSVIEKAPHILPLLDQDIASELQEKLLKNDKISLYTGLGATEILDDSVILENGHKVSADVVLVSIGVRPELDLVKNAGIEIGATGGVVTNSQMQSSEPDIYAVGDMAETFHQITGQKLRIPLAGPANKQGRIAGANVVGGKMSYKGALGTSIVRVFDQVVGTTGLNSRQATQSGYIFFTSITRDWDHASYYPGANMLATKVLVQEGTGLILGAQVLGVTGVDKRIDVLATAITGGLSVHDLENLDLAYAPPFGSANDPINMSGFVASNIQNTSHSTIHANDLDKFDGLLIDVREKSELQAQGKLKGAVHIALGDLRSKLSSLDKNKEIVVYCQKGQRGYLAHRILKLNGFLVKNLKGGFLEAKYNGLEIVSE
ncbi:MAG: FAD-dependent oxidoreductase [Candidatus Cloacimonetes bacterium]|nr:FAD-dependent oxidoreductase [Candidatus Cloacimonadota bacterium]